MDNNQDLIFAENYKKLNPEQKRAVDIIDGPVMVIAGPGTGKTQIIGLRTANLLKHGVDPKNILITTFTEAGVVAIKQRLLEMIGAESYKITVSTIHSFSQSIIDDFPEKFTLEKLSTPIDDLESIEIIEKIILQAIKEKKIEYLTTPGDILYYAQSLSSAVGELRREGVSAKKFEKIIKIEEQKSLERLEEKRANKRIKKIEKYEQEHEKKIGKLREVLYVLKSYETHLHKNGLYDFNDMVLKALKKLEIDDELRYHYAEKYQYIMLDEYQDTNNAQSQIIDTILAVSKEINGEENFTPNIMVVGDDDQSIYRFQGANIENMLDFITRYPLADVIVLKTNYRSTQEILDAATNIIKENKQRLINRIDNLTKNLESFTGEGKNIQIYAAESEVTQKLFIIKEIQALLEKFSQNTEKSDKKTANDIAIIVRSNNEVAEYTKLLIQNNIPVESKVTGNIFENDFIKIVIYFLKIIANPYENESAFADILLTNFSGIPHITSSKILYQLSRENRKRSERAALKIFDILYNDRFLQDAGVEDIAPITTFLEKFEETRTVFSQSNIVSAFETFIDTWRISRIIREKGDFDDLLDLYTFSNFVSKESKKSHFSDLSSFIERISLYEKYNKPINRVKITNNADGVQIMTAHASKGLEFDIVFVPGLQYGNWDNKKTRTLIGLPASIAGSGLQQDDEETEKNIHHEEARRLFFVALTRAKNTLFLTYPISKDNKALLPSEYFSLLDNYDKVTRDSSEQELFLALENEMLRFQKFVDFEEKEIEYIEEILKNYKLSASGLNTFLESPEDFYFREILKFPFIGNENITFGNAYHKALEYFYKRYQESGKIPEKNYAVNIFEKELEKYILTPEEKERMILRGKAGLEGYYDEYSSNLLTPIKTEYRVFGKDIFFENIPIAGILDKIELADKENTQDDIPSFGLFKKKVNIVDYKTGSIKYSEQLTGKDNLGNIDTTYEKGKYARQLFFYKLLFENNPELYENYELSNLKIDFCEGKKGKYKMWEMDYSEEDYEEFKNLVKSAADKIYDIQFWKGFLLKK